MNIKCSNLFVILSLFALLNNLILSQETKANCDEGCLSCSTQDSDKCQICDVFNFFVRDSDGFCSKKEIENCEVASIDSTRNVCMLCEPGYIVDFVQGKCASVHFSKVIDECERYTSFSSCDTCNPGNFMEGGVCSNTTIVIENCERYSRDGVCSKCSDDFFLSLENNSCSKFPKIKNCSHYNRNKCEECKPGFTKDYNFYLKMAANDTAGQSLALSEKTDPQIFSAPDDNCLENEVQNCQIFLSPEKCGKCEEKFFLTHHFTCEPFPINKIKNCEVYKSSTECLRCNELHFVDGSECLIRQNLNENCVEYRTNLDECAVCIENFYLDETPNPPVCLERTKSFKNCVEMNINSETCLKCKDTHFKTDEFENEECQPKIANCKEHEEDISDTNFSKCKECNDGYYLEGGAPQNECKKLKYLANCENEDTSTNSCNGCFEGFYLSEGTCLPHTAKLCASHKGDSDECQTCIAGYIKEGDHCSPITSLENCQSETDSNNCNTCELGYYRSTENKCLMVNLVGCLEQKSNENVCDDCDEDNGFYKGSDDLCYFREIANCEDLNESTHGCLNCVDGFEVNDLGTCSKIIGSIVNCSSASNNANGKCINCDDVTTHFLNPLTNECIDRVKNTNCSVFDKYSDRCTDCAVGSKVVDGSCVVYSIPDNCSSATGGICTACSNGYYLSKSKICVKQDIEGCSAYSSNYGCTNCSSGYILNDLTKVCERIVIPNCKSFSTSVFECETCEDSYFLGSDKRCHRYNMEGCGELEDVFADGCKTCMTGYESSGTFCIPEKEAENCKILDFQDRTLCSVCEEGYYLKDDSTCGLEKDDSSYIANCIKYNFDRSDCEKCENLYYLKMVVDSSICSEISSDFCVESDGVDDACQICQPGYKKVPGGSSDPIQCEEIIQSESPFDFDTEQCYGNNTEDDSYCGVCKPGFMIAKIFNLNLVKLPGCEVTVADMSGLRCFQCYEMYEVDQNTGSCVPLSSSYTGECIKADTSNHTMQEVEDNNKECYVCRNQETHFASESGCTSRTVKIPNCEIYSQNSDSCEKSLSKSITNSPTVKSFACLAIDPNKQIQNCITNSFDYVFNPDNTTVAEKCEVCQLGYKGDTCSDKVSAEELYFDTNIIVNSNVISETLTGNIKREVRGPSSQDSDTLNDQPNRNYIGECEGDFIPVIFNFKEDLVSTKYLYYTTFDPVLKRHDPVARFSAIKECVDPSDNNIPWLGKNEANFPSNNVIEKRLCALAMKIGTTKYSCISCKFGMIGKFYLHETETGNEDLSTIVDCVQASEYGLERKYVSGLGSPYRLLDATAVTDYADWGAIANFAHYDSCSDSSQYPVLYLTRDAITSAPSIYNDEASTAPVPVMKCAEIESTLIASFSQCAVFGVEITDATKADLTNSVNFGAGNSKISCLACKPGYEDSTYSTTTVDGSITDFSRYCTFPISNCDLESPENNILGYCNKCENGYSKHINFDNWTLEKDCVDNTNVTSNCQIITILEGGPSPISFCVLCNPGYYFDYNGNCVEKNDIFCDEMGMPIPNLQQNVSSNDFLRFGILEIGYLIEMQNVGKSNTGCQKCSAGFSLVDITNESIAHGLYHDLNQSTEGCFSITPDDIGDLSCLSCEENYTLVQETNNPNKCVLTSSDTKYKGCLDYKIDPTDGESCVFMKFPYFLLKHPFTRALTPTHIDNTDVRFYVPSTSSSPVVCNSGYIYDFVTQKCVEVSSNDPCVRYHCEEDYYFCVCMECKDSSMSSVTYKYNNDGNSIFKVKCYHPSNMSKLMKSSHMAVLPEGSADDSYGMLTQCISYEYSNPGSFSQINYSFLSDNKFCIPEIRTELNCKEYHEYKYECVSCYDESFLNEFNQCIEGQVPHCSEYDDQSQKCLGCENNYYFNPIQITAEICLPYSVQCEVYAPNYNGCLSCPPYLLLDYEIQAIRRILSSTYQTENTFFSLQSPKERILATTDNKVDKFQIKCAPYTAENCLHYNKYEDSCVVCMEGYYRDRTDSSCKAIEVAYCSIYDQLSSNCLHCQEGFYNDSNGNCVQITKRNCLNYSPWEDACLSCPAFFYLDDNKDCQQTMLIGCEVPMVSSNECSKCAEGFFKDTNNKCIGYTALHCAVYEDGQDKCFLCDEGSFRDETSENCVQYSNASNCESYSPDKDECATCPDGFFLDETKKLCKENTSVYCQQYAMTEDKCVTCLTNYYLDQQGKCLPITALNCLTSSPVEDKCDTCSEEFYFDNETGSCEPYTVFNCQYYNLFKDSCASCKHGYYMKEGSCVPYMATNCSSYNVSSDKCNSCIEGFYIDSLTEICTPYTAVGCSSFNPREDSCISCPPDFFQSPNGCSSYTVKNCFRRSLTADLCLDCQNGFYFVKGKCLAYTVQNCLSKNPKKDMCLSCEKGFYFEFGLCYPYTAQNCATYIANRDQCETCDMSLNHGHVYQLENVCYLSTNVENCVKYSVESDSCSECEYGFYIEDNVCVANPTGIPKCSNYLKSEICGGCEPGYYLKDNACHSPQEEISRCLIYVSESMCEKCETGFSPNEDGLCSENVENSCLENESPRSCKSCEEDYVLTKNDSQFSVCVLSNIPFCLKAVSTVSGVECLQCESGYFYKNGACNSPNELVEFCEEYVDDGLCSKCSDDHVLLANKRTCSNNMNLVSMNCSIGSITAKPYCSRCEGGFFFNSSGNCVQCAEDLANCEVCDLNDMHYCLVCQKGFYMNADRDCIPYPDPEEPNSFKILSMNMMAIMMIVFYLE